MDVGRVILGLRADAKSVRGSLSHIFVVLRDAEPGQREGVEAFYREVVRLVINWMASSDERALREVHGAILEALSQLGDEHPANRYLADEEWLGVHLRGLAIVISSYLRTDNLSKALGQISGRRYDSWRKALSEMLRRRRPIRAGELVKLVFTAPNTADNALKQLADRGMVERNLEGATATYELTWIGEQVATFLERQAGGPDEAVEPDGLADEEGSDSPQWEAARPKVPESDGSPEPTAITASGGEETVEAIKRAYALA